MEKAIQDNEEDIDFDELPSVQALDRMVGMTEVKDQVSALINMRRLEKRCEALGIIRKPISCHMVFSGNPGTGKTTVARLMADIYHEIGLLSKGHIVEVSWAELTGKYAGHPAAMVRESVRKAKGGILFVDHVYSLISREGKDFEHEAVETLLKEMEDNSDDLVVIVAGYPAMIQEFLDSNPGIRSRFLKVIHFPDYSEYELLRIFRKFYIENNIRVCGQVLTAVRRYFAAEIAQKPKNFGNAWEVKSLFEQTLINQANRLIQSGELDR